MAYDINSNILSKAGVSAAQLDAALRTVNSSNSFASASMFTDAEAKYGINALFIAAHAAIESAWGTSYYARTRNNLFGFNAVDSNPDQASSYPSQAAAVDYYASFLLNNYLVSGGRYYNGPTPHGVFVDYSSSHDTEAQAVVDIMNSLLTALGNEGNDMTIPDGKEVTEAFLKYQGTEPTKDQYVYYTTNDKWQLYFDLIGVVYGKLQEADAGAAAKKIAQIKTIVES